MQATLLLLVTEMVMVERDHHRIQTHTALNEVGRFCQGGRPRERDSVRGLVTQVTTPQMEIMTASDSCRVRCRDRHDVCCLVDETNRARHRRRSVQRGDARDSQRDGSRNRANEGDGVRADRPSVTSPLKECEPAIATFAAAVMSPLTVMTSANSSHSLTLRKDGSLMPQGGHPRPPVV